MVTLGQNVRPVNELGPALSPAWEMADNGSRTRVKTGMGDARSNHHARPKPLLLYASHSDRLKRAARDGEGGSPGRHVENESRRSFACADGGAFQS